MLGKLLKGTPSAIALNEHYEADGAIVFGRPARSAGRGSCRSVLDRNTAPAVCSWVKIKNPKAPAVRREAEEDWGR